MSDTTSPTTNAPIPTDEAGLYAYLSTLTPWEQTLTADRLAVQLGGTPGDIARAADLVDQALQDIERDRQIMTERAALAAHLDAAVKEIRAAHHTFRRLAGDLYDVEYAESEAAADMRDYLNDATRTMRAAIALNPCPPDADRSRAVVDAASTLVDALAQSTSENPDQWQAAQGRLIATVQAQRGEPASPRLAAWNRYGMGWAMPAEEGR